MNNDRLRQLLHFYAEDPADPFNSYALALEYKKTDPSQAAFFFGKLLADFPDYLPTYYHAAQFFAEQNESARAKAIFEKGIVLAQTTGQEKTLRELRGALQRWTDEWEE